jgi:hypothetical protein
MVVKGKGRAGSKPSSATAPQAESSESATVNPTPAPIRSTERVEELSDDELGDEEQVSSEHLQALRKRVAEQEEYTRLLRRIKELEHEQSILALQAPRSQNDTVTLPTNRSPRFDKHTLEYRGKNLQELRQWIRAIEDDHENFPDTFTSNQRRIFYASKALKYGSQPYKHWVSKREQVESLDEISWADFLDVLYDALGSKEARMAQAYYNHQEAKWDPKKQSILDFQRKLKSYEETFVNPIDDHYLYYQLWRQIPDEYRDKLIGTNKPKTRDDIVKAIEELEIDRKRDRSKSDAATQPESKRPKHDNKSPSSNTRNGQGRNTKPDISKETNKEGHKPQKDSRNASGFTCYNCGKPGHLARDCYANKRQEGTTHGNPNRVAAATTADSGKAEASPTPSQSQRRKDQ